MRDKTFDHNLNSPEFGQPEGQAISGLIKILESAQVELQELKAVFQSRLQESVREAEAKLRQRLVEEKAQEIKRTEDEVRKAVTRDLLSRFDVEFQKLSIEFEERRQNAIAATENAAQLRLKDALAETAKANEELERFKSETEQSRRETVSRFEAEMRQLRADFEERRVKELASVESAGEVRFTQIFTEAKQDFERREQAIRARFNESFQRATDDFEAERKQLHQRLMQLTEELAASNQARVKLEADLQINARCNTEREPFEPEQRARTSTPDLPNAVGAEVSRIEARMREISQKLDDDSLDLTTKIQLHREQSELEAYLKGLRYSMGELSFDNLS
jgi:hypothetical protein